MTERNRQALWVTLVLRTGAEELILEIWQRAIASGGSFDADYAVFQRVRGEDELSLFFSPSAAALGRVFGARGCVKPSARGLQLLAGSAASFELYFPPRGEHGRDSCQATCVAGLCPAAAARISDAVASRRLHAGGRRRATGAES